MMKRTLQISLIILASFYCRETKIIGQTSVYKVEKLAFNNPVFNEIAPVIVQNGVIFCSDRKASSIRNETTFDNERLYNLYFAEKRDTVKWKSPEMITGTGMKLLYYGPLSVASDGRTVYFTSSLVSGKAARNRKITNPRGIFIGELSGSSITNVRPFEYNNNSYSIAHPSVSRDGRYLFFSSDMPGGIGKSDLYYCENISGKWSQPVNLGPKVNSAASEIYPYIHPTGRLYFTSDRPSGGDFMGGMDVYYTALMFGEWDTPLPMPAPVNSKSDDFAFVTGENLQTGFFTRRTGPSDDIWKVVSTIIRKTSCDTLRENNYCYEFIEENAIKFDTMPVPFKFRWNFGDGGVAEGVTVEHCYKGPGKYLVRLDVVNLLTNEIETNEKTYDLEITQIEQPHISGPDMCTAGQLIKMNADSTYLPGWDINQFYWNFGDETIGLGRQVDKTYLRPGLYNIQLIVSSAPDANGVVREACVSKNIIVNRIP